MGTFNVEDIETTLEKLRASMGARVIKNVDNEWCIFNESGTEKIGHYSIEEFGNDMAKEKALEQLTVISKEEENRANGSGPYAAGPGGECVCPECGYETEHNRNKACTDMKCPECDTTLVRKDVERNDQSDEMDETVESEKNETRLDNMTDEKNKKKKSDEEEESEDEEIVEDKSTEEEEETTDAGESEDEGSEDEDPADGDDDSEEKSTEEEGAETEEERSAIDLISDAIDLVGEDDPALKEVLSLAKGRAENPPKVEDDEVISLRKASKEKDDELTKLRGEIQVRKTHDRVKEIMSKRTYAPAKKDAVEKLVRSMSDEQYAEFLKLNEGKQAYSTEQRGKQTGGKDEKKTGKKYSEKTEKMMEEDPLYRPIN